MKEIKKSGTPQAVSCKIEKLLKRLGSHINRISIMIVTSLMMSGVCFAAEDTQGVIEQGIKSGAKQLYEIMVAIVVPITAVVLVWSALKLSTGDQHDMEKFKKTAIIIVIILALVFMGPLIVEQVAGWFSGVDSMSVFN